MKNQLLSTFFVIVGTLALCAGAYTFAVWSVAQAFFNQSANGSLVCGADRQVVGSELIGQTFASDRYFHGRPSAVGYNAAGAGGSNLSPTNPALAVRARKIIASEGATAERPIPPDLVTASGSGLDPDITAAGALFQVPRVAKARGLPADKVSALVSQHTRQGVLGGWDTVNVLELNMALDAPGDSTAPAAPH